ncbi:MULTISPECIES: helix-turn-helix transcriptional regulator [Brevibacterium]|uniref:Transcriptional regulator PadR-like family protein n=1 Tax=Brevibacterium antiquum CNRZ 918 TaxID=1255637 RepID=A0A2H1ICB1_9MICO|nr:MULTISPECIES: helix-turn-helix transcriptional regulator [Brevibacterium]SMX72734.1 Transcriptional regulator PadR-like family protein [Brevibacterium antiquum CNRZ 918]
MAQHPREDSGRLDENDEWLTHKVDAWVETYKKSMLTPVTLTIVAEHQPIGVAAVAEKVTATTGWHVTERGLYRTLKRLQDSGLLASTDTSAPRTGAKRKDLSLTPLGTRYLAGIADNIVDLPRSAPDGGAN